jgi:uncharacterized phiE125 gp8 family phage protein
MKLSIVSPPAALPLTADEARARIQTLSSVSDDSVVEALIGAATASLDGPNGFLQRAIITQTWDLTLDAFDHWRSADEGIEIPLPPSQSVDSITYIDSDVEVALSSGDYRISPGSPSRIYPVLGGSWPTSAVLGGSVTIRFTAGYGYDGSSVPENIKIAIALKAGHIRSLLDKDLYLSHEQIGQLSRSFTLGGGAGAAITAAIESLVGHLRVATVPR